QGEETLYQGSREFHPEEVSLLKSYQTGGNPGPAVPLSRRNGIRSGFRLPVSHFVYRICSDADQIRKPGPVTQEPFFFISFKMVIPNLNWGISSFLTIS
ncbi:MAG: hypothetical protein D3922_13335, partial [Candidatus Electrothrix sp. AR1]|nr:hypothetical protein [Candidatus Electrothrix sp. AR1]